MVESLDRGCSGFQVNLGLGNETARFRCVQRLGLGFSVFFYHLFSVRPAGGLVFRV